MYENIKNTSMLKSLFEQKNLMHSYLFYSADKELNNMVAMCFAKSILCEQGECCCVCDACKQFDAKSHPDLTILDQESIKVENINNIISKLSTLPISATKKVFVILNAENMNEIAQNKLLKSLEEPNDSTVFIMTTSKTDKLLKTVLSRVNKIYLQKLSLTDKELVASDLLNQGIDIRGYLEKDFSITDMMNFVRNADFLDTIEYIKYIFSNLNTTSDIPGIVSKMNLKNKEIFFSTMQDIILSTLKSDYAKYDKDLIDIVKAHFNEKVLSKIVLMLDDAYKKQMSNVNFTYILDNLLFNILKEKFYAAH